MQKLNKNRLIGGIVLVFAGLLFVPAILTPPQHTLVNPTFSMNREVTPSPSAMADSSLAHQASTATIPHVPELQLASVDDQASVSQIPQLTADHQQRQPASVIDTNNQPQTPAKDETRLIPISLESVDTSSTSTSKAKPSQVHPPTASVASPSVQSQWVRVGSFTDMGNAKKVAGQMKRKQYAVKIKPVKVSGVVYQRVLVGPFDNETTLRQAMQQIQSSGYQPAIQR